MPRAPQKFYEKMAEMKEDKHNLKLGKAGEKKAVKYLRRQGYKIVERNWKNPFGEVDVIAFKDDVYAFVEVKTRLSDVFGLPSEAVNFARKQKYIRGAEYYFLNKNIVHTVRFDIIEIFKNELNHIENAFIS